MTASTSSGRRNAAPQGGTCIASTSRGIQPDGITLALGVRRALACSLLALLAGCSSEIGAPQSGEPSLGGVPGVVGAPDSSGVATPGVPGGQPPGVVAPGGQPPGVVAPGGQPPGVVAPGVQPPGVVAPPAGPMPGVAPPVGVTPQGPLPGAEEAGIPEVLRGIAPPDFNLKGDPLYLRAVRITNDQWAHTVQDILNLQELPRQADSFLNPSGGFSLFLNNEKVLDVTNVSRDSYAFAAAEIAALAAGDQGGIDRIGAGNDPEAFVRTLGRRAFRRPLTEEEATRYTAAFEDAVEQQGDAGGFADGASLVIEAMLQSPHFIYRTELAPSGQSLSGYELAAKLSFWILGTAPSDDLLDKAERGELDTPDGVGAVAAEMLQEDAATPMAVDMFAEMFKFARYSTIVKATPDYKPEMGVEAEEASRRFFQYVFEEGHGLREVLTSTRGFAGPALGPLYGVQTGGEVEQQDFGAERAGFFSHVPYLMLMGNNDRSDAIHRGLFVNDAVLCASLPEPNFELPEPGAAKPGQSDREYTEELTGIGTCGQTCHGAYINPMGYAFENFDGLGRVREMDTGKPVDTTSAYPFRTGWEAFEDAPALMAILSESQEAHSCFAKHIASYGLQRDIVADDQALVDQLAAASLASNGSMRDLIVELVKSPAFHSRPAGK